MDRRSYIVGAGLFLTGCSGTSTETSEPTATDTRTSSSTPTLTETETPTETATPSPTDKPTVSPTPEPSDLEIQLRRAIEDLDTALNEFALQNGTIYDITATSGTFSERGVRKAVENARGHLGAAEKEVSEETPEELRTQLERLTGVRWFFWWAGPAQAAVKNAGSDLRDIERAAYAADDLSLGSNIDYFKSDIDSTQTNLDKLTRDSDPEDAAAPCELTEEQYRKKVAQFEAEIADMQELVKIFQKFGRLVEQVRSGLDNYEAESYENASSTFYSASSSFEDQAESMSENDFQETFNSFVNRIICVSEAMSAGCSELDVAATAGMNGNDTKRRVAERNAEDAFEECDLIFEHMTFLAEFYDIDTSSSLSGFIGSITTLLGN